MKEILLASITFTITSICVLSLVYFAGSIFTLQKAIALPLLIILVTLFLLSKSSRLHLINKSVKWNILAIVTIFVQIIIISSGGLESPFLIFIHLLTIGISLSFSFSIGIIFMLVSFLIIFLDLAFRQNIMTYILANPNTTILQIFSLLPIIPVCYIVTQHYHFKDKLFKTLNTQVIADESILANVDELIVITDNQLRILSINEAVERELQKSDSELIGKPVFEIFLIKDSDGKLINKQSFSADIKNISQLNNKKGELTLINSRHANRKIHIHTQNIQDAGGNVEQISFIISYQSYNINSNFVSSEKAKAKYDAIIEKLKQDIHTNSLADVNMEIILLEKIENDIYTLHSFEKDRNQTITRFDITQLCRQTIAREQKFFTIFKVPVNFEILNFGEKEITQLTVHNFPVKPDQLTGHFFTVENDINQVNTIIKKLIDLGVFLSSSEKNPDILLTIQRLNKTRIVLKMESDCRQLSEDELRDITNVNYNKIQINTNLHFGSGLEGYLIKTMCGELNIPLNIHYSKNKIIFSLYLKKAKTI